MLGKVDRRVLLGLASGFAGACYISPLWAQQAASRRDLAIQRFEGLAGKAYRVVPAPDLTPGIGRVPRNVAFARWERHGRVFATDIVTELQRLTEVVVIERDGRIVQSSSMGRFSGFVEQDGSLLLEGSQRFHVTGQEEMTRRLPVLYEETPIRPGVRRARYSSANFRLPFEVLIEEIAYTEATAIAANLYPSEYDPSRWRRSNLGSRAKVALLVGISSYTDLADLANPINDITAVATRLRGIGYSTQAILNPTLDQLNDSIARFGVDIASSGDEVSSLFYFAGHAVEVGNRNYLLPSDIRRLSTDSLETGSVPLDVIVSQTPSTPRNIRLIVVDACRNPPGQLPEAGSGLARLSAPEGSYIAFSTAPGMVAEDGVGRLSPFARAFVRELENPRRPIEELFRGVRRTVVEATDGAQVPWDSSSLLEPFALA
jgi:hypothetical protein